MIYVGHKYRVVRPLDQICMMGSIQRGDIIEISSIDECGNVNTITDNGVEMIVIPADDYTTMAQYHELIEITLEAV